MARRKHADQGTETTLVRTPLEAVTGAAAEYAAEELGRKVTIEDVAISGDEAMVLLKPFDGPEAGHGWGDSFALALERTTGSMWELRWDVIADSETPETFRRFKEGR